jgi:hypothetical protein
MDTRWDSVRDILIKTTTHYHHADNITIRLIELGVKLAEQVSVNLVQPELLQNIAETWVEAGEVLNKCMDDIKELHNAEIDILQDMKELTEQTLSDCKKLKL